MIAGISYLDAALVVMVVISGLVAMYRGFTREFLSIISWAAAGAVAIYVTLFQGGWATALATQFADKPDRVHFIIAQIAIGSAFFLVVLIVVHLITSHISDSVLDSRVGAIDRVLGLGFGVVRGFILVVIPYMFFASFVCKGGAPQALIQGCQPGELPWVESARSGALIQRTGSTLFGFLDRIAQRGTSSG
ncbi:MAG TPA: CvpA family protein [Hyphomicrobiaceae bacterium]|jgi:membrane protein required for colicin V production